MRIPTMLFLLAANPALFAAAPALMPLPVKVQPVPGKLAIDASFVVETVGGADARLAPAVRSFLALSLIHISTTPEAAVLSPGGELLYLGRIDNRLEDFGKQRVRVSAFDLRDTLEAILNGRAVPHARTRALGCAITRKD